MLFDTHAHLYFDSLAEKTEEILRKMREKNVARSIQIGCDIPSSEQAIRLAQKYPENLRATVGIHPSECLDLDLDETMQKLESLLRENRDIIVGIGEIGLDYHWIPEIPDEDTRSEKEREDFLKRKKQEISNIQKRWFRAQAELAKKYHLPVIIHTRDARDDTLECIRNFGIEYAIMHCYSEDPDFAKILLARSDEIYFSFSGILTYKKSEKIQETAKMLPLERILIETDAPFLAPQTVRGSVNESSNVRYVFEKLCEIREESPEIIEETLWKNSCRVYQWK